MSIVRINNDNYEKFSEVLEWRGTGNRIKKSEEEVNKVKGFFEEHNIFESNHFLLYGAKLNEKYVGYVGACFIPKPDKRLGLMYVDELWVHSDYRGKGISQKLLDKIYEEAEKQGVWRVRLYVGAENDSARRAYKKNGYEEKGDCIFCERE